MLMFTFMKIAFEMLKFYLYVDSTKASNFGQVKCETYDNFSVKD